jgi:hypothetical protein
VAGLALHACSVSPGLAGGEGTRSGGCDDWNAWRCPLPATLAQTAASSSHAASPAAAPALHGLVEIMPSRLDGSVSAPLPVVHAAADRRRARRLHVVAHGDEACRSADATYPIRDLSQQVGAAPPGGSTRRTLRARKHASNHQQRCHAAPHGLGH